MLTHADCATLAVLIMLWLIQCQLAYLCWVAFCFRRDRPLSNGERIAAALKA